MNRETDRKEQKSTQATNNKPENREYRYFYSQVVAALILLIALLLIRAWNAGWYQEIKEKYQEYFGKDVPLSVENILEDIKIPDAQETTAPAVIEITTAPAEATVPAPTTGIETGASNAQTISTGLVSVSENITDMSDTSTTTETGDSYVECSSNALFNRNAMMVPVSGRISSPFGYRIHPITGIYSLHGGMDIAASIGTPVDAALDGIVEFAGEKTSYGNCIILRHSGGLQTVYAHCSELKTETGKQVKKGDIIALVGSTGDSTGPHLHFEIRMNGIRMDPQWILPVQ